MASPTDVIRGGSLELTSGDIRLLGGASKIAVTRGQLVFDGTLDTSLTNKVPSGERGIYGLITQDTGVALSGTLDGIYARATAGDTTGSGTIRGAEIGARLDDNVTSAVAAVVTGGYFWADAKGKTATILRGVEVSLDGGAGGTSTTAQGVVIFNNSSATQTTSIGLDVNGGTPTGHKAFTYDIRLQNGETIDNATDGTVKIGGVLGVGKSTLAAALDPGTLSDSYIGLVSNVVSTANPTVEVTLSGGYFKAATTTANQANCQLVGVLSRASMGKNALDCYGIQSHTSLVDGAESTGNMTAVSGKTILYDDNASGIVTAGLFTLEGQASATHGAVPRVPNTCYGVWVDVVDVTTSAGLIVNANNSTVASGVKLTKMGTGAITADVTLQNGETIDNATDGVVKISADQTLLNGGATNPALRIDGAGSKSSGDFATAGTAWVDGGTPALAADQMYLRIYVGSTVYRIPLWADA